MSDHISLIPDSLIQFETIALDHKDCTDIAVKFYEQQRNGPNGETECVLRMPQKDQDSGNLVFYADGQEHVVPDEAEYQIKYKDIYKVFKDEWVPLPYLARIGATDDEGFKPGPANWVRGRLRSEYKGPGEEVIFLNIAFDTSIAPYYEGRYLAPTPDDEARGQSFAFVPDLDSISWLIDSAWLKDWLAELLHDANWAAPSKKRYDDEDDGPSKVLAHVAIYLAFLRMIAQAGRPPVAQMLTTMNEPPVSVDLVLDLGNFRSCGILIEEHPGARQREADSYVLELRDLAKPEQVCSDPFSSRLEFGKAVFGRDSHSRRSGRSHAFAWASPVRTGPEAERMMGARIGTEGLSGLSAPKRYLWDMRPSDQGWRFNNGHHRDGQSADPPVNGPFRRALQETLRDKRSCNAGAIDMEAAQPVGPSVLSRSLLFTLMLSEVVMQALMYMNSPGFRSRRRDSARPRGLRSLMLTMPPGMPVAEQKIFQARAQAALAFVWKVTGQKGPLPILRAELDEATATQIVWLHNEVTGRLGGHVEALFELYSAGRRGENNLPAIRVASIDIGGGTTDLMITTYTHTGHDALSPCQNFRESFNIAGDDLLEEVILTTVIPPLERALTKAGVLMARELLIRLFERDHGNQDERDRHRRRLFVATILEPAALHALSLYEQVGEQVSGVIGSFGLNAPEVVRGDDAQRARCAAFLAEQVNLHMQGQKAPEIDAFDVYGVEIEVTVEAVEKSIRATLEAVLSNLTEVVWAYGCDVLILSGRPSKLRRVRNLITGAMPVAPHRIIAMHDYTVGRHYPFTDTASRISDPKTTVVVGAALCIQAEGRLQNFVLRTEKLVMQSTARYIGKMEKTGRIRDADLLYTDPDPNSPPGDISEGFDLDDFQGLTMIGFRQLPLERWTTTPLYCVEFAQNSRARMQNYKLPLNIEITRKSDRAEEEEGDFSGREGFVPEKITDAQGDEVPKKLITLRLQTTLNPEGYWRDTGCLAMGVGMS
ncbi:MAG: virulence factor SrfB [Acetobacter sp.]